MMSEPSTIIFTVQEVEKAVGEAVKKRLISCRDVPVTFIRRAHGKFLFSVGPLDPKPAGREALKEGKK